ncbi:unnamed protein product [Phytophthora lilii]|uniref:Unnamed protein product n=1 Tax=Phytophthora lilii TaxID=2077276 RepID=A0A9W6WX73_9STRA|nr:unnamed protein product [Phytophthora lilii]
MHCPIVAKAKKLSQGSAHMATAVNESGSASEDSEQGEIWVADATQKPEEGALLYREPQAKASYIVTPAPHTTYAVTKQYSSP